MKGTRVLIGDDHALMLNGIRALLDVDFTVVGTACDGRGLVDAALSLKPDMVILDVSMPVLNGFEAAQQISAALPATRIIFLSMHSNPMYLRKALESGARAYVLKTGVMEELLEAMRRVQAGETWISPGFGHDALQSVLDRSGKPSVEAGELTARQREILQLIAEGRVSKEIAHIVGISVKTVDFHRARMMARLGVHSVAELVRCAVEQNLLPALTPLEQ